MSGGDIRCPACRELDWYRNGLTLVELSDGSLVSERVGPEREGDDTWSCMSCGYEVPGWSALNKELGFRLGSAGSPSFSRGRD
jgi:hypothetical protein